MTQKTKHSNYTDALHHCEQSEAIQRKKHLVWIASFLAMTTLFLASCEKEIEFNGEQTDPKLVINSLLEPGQPIKASISKSFFFLDNEADTEAPDDLVAMLYVNGESLGEMTLRYDTVVSYEIWNPNESNMGRVQKVYTHDYCPVAGDVIKITASANGFDDVEATTSPLPNDVVIQLESEVTKWNSFYNYIYDDTIVMDSLLYISANVNLTLNITDPNPGQVDYFKIHIQRSKRDIAENHYVCNFDYDDPVFGSAMPDNDIVDFSDLETKPEGVFTDMLFDGRSYQLRFKLQLHITVNEDEYDPDFFQLPIRLQHLNKEYYYYLNTCDQGEEIISFFAEPIQTYTNVEGGYGIVGGQTVDTLWYALPLEER